MKVISQYFGYVFKLLAFIICVYISTLALEWIYGLHGIWGVILGALLLPVTDLAFVIDQSLWLYLLGLVVGGPLLWMLGSRFIRLGRG